MSARRRIAVLFHETDRSRPARRYIVHLLAEYWRQWGHDVCFIYGVQRVEAADLLFVHVDLSVVPEEYLEFASRYAVTVTATCPTFASPRSAPTSWWLTTNGGDRSS